MMNRRQFVGTGLLGGGALATGALDVPGLGAEIQNANDIVELGPEKIKLSRLAIGTGTLSGRVQRRLGMDGLPDLLHYGYDQGVFHWDTGYSYKTHPHFKEALKRVPREKVTVMTKTPARTADDMRKALDQYLEEMGTDYIDIVLLHCLTDRSPIEQREGAMEVLSEAKEKGTVRTIGASYHSIKGLQAAAKTPWLEVVLARINPLGVRMDADTPTVISALKDLKAAGKGVIGMKILGEGVLSDRVDMALQHAVSLDCLDCFTIGPGNKEELDGLIKGIPAASEAVKAA